MPEDFPVVKTTESYRVGSGSGDVHLGLSVGEGQFGTSRAKLDGTVLAVASGPMTVRLGSRSELKGTQLTVRTIVSDVNSMTNRMSVTYRITGGTDDLKKIAKGKVTIEGDFLVFDGTFDLV
jgi:hypothetical protein